MNMYRVDGVEVHRTGIKAHPSPNLGERYHEPLRKTLRNLITAFRKADKHLTFTLSVKGMKDTLGPDGIVSTALVFGECPPV